MIRPNEYVHSQTTDPSFLSLHTSIPVPNLHITPGMVASPPGPWRTLSYTTPGMVDSRPGTWLTLSYTRAMAALLAWVPFTCPLCQVPSDYP